MVKLLAFDIDNTLAGINEPIKPETIDHLKRFESQGLKVAFVSGKPAIYISGMVRQVGLEQPIVIGENGLNIYYGCQVPPLQVIDADVDNSTKALLMRVKGNIVDGLGDLIWYQPNAVSVTAFPKSLDDMPKLQQLVQQLFTQKEVSDHLVFYQHADSIDIAPKHVNKGNAMKSLLEKEGWLVEDVIAIGDGENDIPMFHHAGYTIGVSFKGEFQVDVNVESINEAMREIIRRI